MEEKTNEPEVNIYLMTSCRAPRQKEAWYISLIEYKTAKGPVTKQWIRKEEDVTRHQVELEGLLVALESLKKPCALSIYADSSYLESAFNRQWVDAWMENDWKTAHGKEISNREKWTKVLKILKPHDFRICIKTDHEYGEWMRRTLRDATPQKKGEDKHV